MRNSVGLPASRVSVPPCASAIDPAIRVMFITGFAAVALQAGKTAPEAKLLSKPFHLKDLVAEVDRMFQTEDQHGRL